jgi:transmembrane sensor
MQPADPLRDLGKALAEEQDDRSRAAGIHEHVRARLFAGPNAGPSVPAKRGRAQRVGAVVGALAVAACLVVGFFFVSRSSVLDTHGREASGLAPSFRVEGQVGQVGKWIQVAGTERIPITFANGSALSLSPGTRVRVSEMRSTGADVVLERGQATVSVVKEPGARWQFHVGPFDVTVIGTKFDTSWDPARERFTLAMLEGSVEVSGPSLDRAKRVVAGERLEVSVATGALGVNRTTPAAGEAASVEKGPDGVSSPRELASAAAPDPETPTWRALAQKGDYRASLEAAKVAGFEHECATRGSQALLELGDVARYAGDGARARLAYEAVRRRFRATADGSLAAFALGRQAFMQHDYPAAERWFSTYLDEQPGGPLSREASGRLLEVLNLRADSRAAAAARAYLDRYPDGPHAALAKRVLHE